MSLRRCPGSSTFAQPQIQLVECPDCGTETEIWSDEAIGTCPKCGRSVIRTGSTSCVDWCRYAEDCLGKEGYAKYAAMKADLLRSSLLAVFSEQVGQDTAVVARCNRTIAFAEEIAAADATLDPPVVISLALTLLLKEAGVSTDSTTVGDLLTKAGCPPVVIDQCTKALAEETPAPATIAAKDAIVLGEFKSGRCDADRLQNPAAIEVASRQ